MSTLADFRLYVRTHLDVDDDEMPNILVDSFIREGAEQVQYARGRWKFYESLWVLPSQIGVSSYSIDGLLEQDGGTGEIDEIRSIFDDNRLSLRPIGSFPPAANSPTGIPFAYSTWGGKLTLHDTPDSAQNYTIAGYKKPTDWVSLGSTASPDTPALFDEVIRAWALGRAYAHQDIPESAISFYDTANFKLERLLAHEDDIPPVDHLIINGGASGTNRGTDIRLLER